MHIRKKALSLILVLCFCLSLIPATAFASESEYVYMSVSYDGEYVKDTNGNPIARVPVSLDTLSAVDLDAYGLSEYAYDEDGDGEYEITALHLVIYAHENIYGGSWSDVTFTGTPGSSYFQGGVFGFDENLNYYLNGEYPLAGEGWGATTENIVLEANDSLDIASFGCWGFYSDPAFGFHYFADPDGNITGSYTVEEDSACNVKLIRGAKDANYNSQFFDEPNYTISYGRTLFTAEGTTTTGSDGSASITFAEAGTYYLWCSGGHGTDGVNEQGMGYHDYCDYYTNNSEPCIVSSPAYATVTVTAKEELPPVTPPETSRTPQDVSAVLNATMAKLAATVTAPQFGTSAGEWTVLSLARGGYYAKDNAYFTDYYDRIVETVNTTAAAVNMNGALHKNKSTENSRLIVALSAIGKDATSVGDWNLITPYEDFNWIVRQGINGPTWALIALDSNNYQTQDPTIRQQCIEHLLRTQHNDGGWAGSLDLSYASDPDYTGMALQALYPYRNQSEVAAACEKAFACLSDMQLSNGGFSSDGAETAESAAQVIVACSTWGINPDTDSRFIKNEKSVVDALLAFYVEDSAQFQHGSGSGENGMATDQACYALVAYNRLLEGKNALYDCSDVTFDAAAPSNPTVTPDGTITATLTVPAELDNEAGTTFNATIQIDEWDNEAGYKLIDFEMRIPEGLKVTSVTAGTRLAGGDVNYNLAEDGKLRCAYFDASENSDLTISGENFPAEVFCIGFEIEKKIEAEALKLSIIGMSVKLGSDSSDENDIIVVDTVGKTEGGEEGGGTGNEGSGTGNITLVEGMSCSAVCLYTGSGIDLIPADKKAVAVSVTKIENGPKLTYNDGTNEIEFLFNSAISEKIGVSTYIALVDAAIEMENFMNEEYYTVGTESAKTLSFGDTNADAAVNAQDALAVVNAWLRKGDAPEGTVIISMNVNGDGNINTFDALGIVEAFVSDSDYVIVTNAASAFTNTSAETA